jgi:hypothetical protein
MYKISCLLVAFLAARISLAQIQIEDSSLLTRERWRDSVLRMDLSQVPTGFLWEYSQFGFEPTRYDGVNNDDDTIAEEGQIFALHNILYLSKVNSNANIYSTDTLFKQAFFSNLNSGVIPLLFIYQPYNKIRQSSLSEGLLTIAQDSVGMEN